MPLLSRQNEWMENLCWLNNNDSLEECVKQCLSFDLPEHLPYKPAVARFVTNSPMTGLSGACGSPSLMLCADTALCVLYRRVNEAQPRLPSSSSCFGYSSMSAYIPAWITRKGGGHGFSWQRARLWEAHWSKCPLASMLVFASLATGQQPVLPGIFALPEKPQLLLLWARYDIMLMWYSSSNHMWVL